MLTFKELSILLEDRISFLKDTANKYDKEMESKGKKYLNTEHDTLAKHKTNDAIIDHLTSADPTPNKKHIGWIVGQYRKGHIRQEDIGKIKETLGNFEKHSPKLAKKDINSYSHIADVDKAVEPHLGTFGSKKEEEKSIKHEGADLVHSDKTGLTIHHIKTEAAAKLYGKGTKWCTSGDCDNMFDEYNKQGNMHVIHSPEGKFQYHGASGQFMDTQDREVSKDKFKNLVNAHPSIKKVPSIHPFIIKHMPEEIDKMLDGHPDYVKS